MTTPPAASSAFTPLSRPNAPPLSRLARYEPRTHTYTPLTGPLEQVTQDGCHVYVVTHGWAEGFSDVMVDYAKATHGKMLTVWETLVWHGSNPGPAGAWIFKPTSDSQKGITVSPVGMAHAITQLDPLAIVLVYSWLDGAATPANLLDGHFSQANTDMFGLIAGQAIQMALPEDFVASGGLLHLIGHSDGTKVMTIAAAELIEHGIPVTQLTLFDSPENSTARSHDSANFLWYYLARVPGARPAKGPVGTFIDNYISMFGTTLSAFNYTDPKGTAVDPLSKDVDLNRIVDTTLQSQVLYGTSSTEDGNRHCYAPAWYSGTSVDTTYGGNVYGLGWSPLLHAPSVAGALHQAEVQTWTVPTQKTQFALASASTPAAISPAFALLDPTNPAPTKLMATRGKVGVEPVSVTGLPTGVNGLSFSYKFEATTPMALAGATLKVTLGERLLFMMEGMWSGTQARTATLNAASLATLREGTLTFTLEYDGPGWVNATIANLYYFTGLDT
ncbi:hypothetical protein [Myxococcus stipitatus]|nr:hypothetical protein [Myxococcus stipitatus]